MSGDDHREPTDAQLDAAGREVDELLDGTGVDLSDPSLWEPAPDLEDSIMAAATEPGVVQLRVSRLIGVAAVVVAVLALGGISLIAARSNAPDWSVTLAATDIAPGASGAIEGWNEQSGTRVVLGIDGLDAAPDGYFYELWFSEGPVHISAGTFRETHDVELWAGVTRRDFPRLWITLEQIDGDEAPSGMTVLDTG